MQPSSHCQRNFGCRPCLSELRGNSGPPEAPSSHCQRNFDRGPPEAVSDGMGMWKLQETRDRLACPGARAMWYGEGNHRWGLPSHWRVLSRPSSHTKMQKPPQVVPKVPRCSLGSCRRCSTWSPASALGSCAAASTSLEVVQDVARCRRAASMPRSGVGDNSDPREAILSTMPCLRAAEMRRGSGIFCVSRCSRRMWHSSRRKRCLRVRRGMALRSRTGAFPWRLVSHSNSRGRRRFD